MADDNKWNDDDDFDSEDGDFGIEHVPEDNTPQAPKAPRPKNLSDAIEKKEEPVLEKEVSGKQIDEFVVSRQKPSNQETPIEPHQEEENKRPERNNDNDQGNRYERKPREQRYDNNDRMDRGGNDNYDRKPRDNDRERRGGRGGNREQHEKKDYTFNPDSNFRKFYLNDPQFYQVVIRQEAPPYEFKIHLFLDGPKTETSLTNREISLQIMEKIADLGGKDIREQFLAGRNNAGDKIRYTFIFEDQQKALECYNFFNMYSQRQQDQKRGRKVKPLADESFNLTEQLKIYLQKDEAIFEKFGDEEAKLYNDMQAMEQATRAQRQNDAPKFQKNDKHRKGGENRETTKEDAEKMGFNFTRGGPPKFKNTTKKEDAPKNHDKDLRAIINDEQPKDQTQGEPRQYDKNKNRGGQQHKDKQNDYSKDDSERGQVRRRGGRGGQNGEQSNDNQKTFVKKEYKEKPPARQVFDDPNYTPEEEKKDGERNQQRRRGGNGGNGGNQQMKYQPKNQGNDEERKGNNQEGGRGGRGGRGGQNNQEGGRGGRGGYNKKPYRDNNKEGGENGEQQQYKKKKQYTNNQTNQSDKPGSAISKAQGELSKQGSTKLQKQTSNRFAAMEDDF